MLLIAAGSSCNFVVTSTDGGLTESSAREEGFIDDGFVVTTTTTEEQPVSFGIFCESNNSDSEGVGVVMIVIVRLFYLLSLVLTFVLVIVTLLRIMHSSTSTSYSSHCNYNNNNNEDELWKRLARLSITSIICHMPVLLLLLDSRHHCTDDDDDDNDDDGGRCTLGNGSLSYFLSILALTSLTLVVKFNTMPDWKEEYELWKLVRQRHAVEMEKLDDMTIERKKKKKKDGHNDVVEDPKNSTMMSDDDDYDNDDDNMDEERRSERRRCPTIPLVIQCPVSEDEDKNSSMMMTMMMMMPTNDTSKSSRRYKGNIMQNETNERAEVKKCGGERQQRTSSSPTSVIVENGCCEFHPPLPTTPACSVMVVTDEELGHHHPSFNKTYLQLSFSTINNNQVQIMDNDDEVMHNNIPQSNDCDDTENVNPGNDPTRIANLAKEGVHQYEDPELDMYPSDSSLSELSLDSDDDRQQNQQSKSHSHQDACNDNKTKIAKADCSSIIYLSDSSADGEFTSDDNDSESEMYAIIAGVRKLNRRMSGKTAPQYKRRRRRKGTSDDVSTVKSFMSHGSLLDEIIHEESTECDGPSPPRMTISTKKKKREDNHHHQHHDGEVDDCYPSLNNSNELTNYEELLQSLQSSSSVSEIDSMKNDHNPENDIHALLDRSGDFSCGDGGDAVSDSDESMSLRASQARKQRIVSAQRFSLLPHDSDTDDDNVYNSCNGVNSVNSDGVNFRGISNRPPSLAVIGAIACENELSDASKKHITDISSNSNHINSAWQVRQVRMARLRMSRGEQEKPSPALKPEGKIIRAIDSIVTCYSDENSI